MCDCVGAEYSLHQPQALFGPMSAIFPREKCWGVDFLELEVVGGPQALLTKKGLLEMLTSASRLLTFAFFLFYISPTEQ